MRNHFATAIFIFTMTGIFGYAQAPAVQPAPLKGRLERIKVPGKSLEGNLMGDSPDRDTVVYLPPSYSADTNRRYPVVYMLHGFTDSEDRWFGFRQHFVNVPSGMEKVLAAGTAKEVILVMPNAFTAFQGSMYSNSVTTGDWESFVARDLVAYMDSHYRTIANTQSRGLTGHSMGGYGTVRIAMKYPEVFSAIYILSPCCLPANHAPDPAQAAKAEKVHSAADITPLDFGTKALLALAAAWSPNPKKPPLFLDLPVKDGVVQPDVIARWAANSPLAMIDQYIPSLRKIHAIAMDAGAQDTGIAEATKSLHEILTQYGIEHASEIYHPGTHVSRIEERLETHVFPFFSKHLSFSR
jgi:S-formylglutathione hydrolase